MNSKHAGREETLALHPTVKPIALVADAILDCSNRGGIVLDAFLGSGTTLLAAERTSRVCHGIELDPGYIDVAIQRWQEATGQSARLGTTGQSFAEVTHLRQANSESKSDQGGHQQASEGHPNLASKEEG